MAMAKTFRQKLIVESGELTNIADLAEREGIAPYYMTRVLLLTLLSPEIVEAIYDGRLRPLTVGAGAGSFCLGMGGTAQLIDESGDLQVMSPISREDNCPLISIDTMQPFEME